MSRTVGRPKRSSTKSPRIERLQRGLVAHQRADVAAAGGDDPAGEAIGLGMHGGRVERLLAVADPQEAGRLLEGLRRRAAAPSAGPCGVANGAVGVAVGDDRLGERRPETGDAREQRR